MQQENMLENLDFCHHLTQNKSNENMGEYGFDIPAIKSFCSSSFYSQAVKFQETVESITTPEARAIAASKNHKEAERRRRERINSHLDRLRTLLSCNSKVISPYK